MDDFLIIGGGIAGTSAGARLATLGRVTLLEAETALGYHASGRSAALFEPYYGLAPTVALSLASAEFLEAAGVLSPRGLMFVASAEEEEQFAHDIAGMALEEIGPEAACARVPVLDPARITRAAWHADAWDVDTDRLIQDFAREIRANGRVVTGARVTVAVDWWPILRWLPPWQMNSLPQQAEPIPAETRPLSEVARRHWSSVVMSTVPKALDEFTPSAGHDQETQTRVPLHAFPAREELLRELL